MNTYTARAVRSGNWWAIDVPELPADPSFTFRPDQPIPTIEKTPRRRCERPGAGRHPRRRRHEQA